MRAFLTDLVLMALYALLLTAILASDPFGHNEPTLPAAEVQA